MKKLCMLLLLCSTLVFAQDDAATSTTTETTSTETTTEITVEGDTPTEVSTEVTDAVETKPVGLLELLSQDDRLSTFTLLLAASDLLSSLESSEYTLFAPTNYAFNLATEELVDVLADSDAVIALLRGHIVAGALPQAELSDGTEITSANGASFTVKSDGVSVVIGDASVLQADIAAGSSLIHVVDSVLR